MARILYTIEIRARKGSEPCPAPYFFSCYMHFGSMSYSGGHFYDPIKFRNRARTWLREHSTGDGGILERDLKPEEKATRANTEFISECPEIRKEHLFGGTELTQWFQKQ